MNSAECAKSEIVGTSLVIKKNLEFICKAAKSDKNILILGETGTGKDLTARKIHELSDRRRKQFVAINCTNIPEDLFEAELFGFAKGSFTGANKHKIGLFEAAQNGSVFIDEIGDLSLYLQAKILRIIEERKLRRIGETITRTIHARFIFATNKDLLEEVKKGKFRKDLYFRINVIRFYIPPLKDRKEDIPLLVNHILEKERKEGEPKKVMFKTALKKLISYEFPGNIRELENIIKRACFFSEKSILTERDIKLDYEFEGYEEGQNITPERLKRALESCRWNKTKAAIEIGKSRRHFYRLLEKYQMADCIRRDHSI